MEQEEIERRLSALEERTAMLEGENYAHQLFAAAVVGSHPAPEQLLRMLNALIEQLPSEAKLGAKRAHVLARLEKLRDVLQSRITTIESNRQRAARQKAQEQEEAARERMRQRDEEQGRSFGM